MTKMLKFSILMQMKLWFLSNSYSILVLVGQSPSKKMSSSCWIICTEKDFQGWEMLFLFYAIAVIDVDDANSSSQILEGYCLELKREPISFSCTVQALLSCTDIITIWWLRESDLVVVLVLSAMTAARVTQISSIKLNPSHDGINPGHVPGGWVNNPALGDFCFAMILRNLMLM